jgi:hypothetical protein
MNPWKAKMLRYSMTERSYFRSLDRQRQAIEVCRMYFARIVWIPKMLQALPMAIIDFSGYIRVWDLHLV